MAETRIFEYVYGGPAFPLIDIYGSLAGWRSSEWCLLAVVAGSIAAALAPRRKDLTPARALWELAWPTLALFATYALTWCNVDEVSVNLEHPFNLYHFGRFSFAPSQMVDGTVEYAYYLLLTPFGWSAASLVAANYWLGFLLAWLHLCLLFFVLRNEVAVTRLGLLMLFAVNAPIVAIFSNGFGAGLVSLAFFLSLVLHFERRTTAAWLVASLLPLLRPDALLCSYALLLATTDLRDLKPTMKLLARWAAPAAAAAVYLLGVRVFYGDWIPTPIAFKSVHPSMLQLSGLKEISVMVMTHVAQPAQFLAIVALAASVWFRDDARIAVLRRLVWPISAVYLFYLVSHTAFGDFTGDIYSRYWIAFYLTLFLILVLNLTSVSSALAVRQERAHALVFSRMMPIVVILLGVAAVLWSGARTDVVRNRNDQAQAGQLLARVLPANLSVSTSELNTFGLLLPDHDVVDVWGYTNPAIAGARVVNGARIRTNPEFFLSASPDVYLAYPPPDEFSSVEAYAAGFHHFTKHLNLLGDMHRVLDSYDVVIIRHPGRDLFLLVRRAAQPALRDALTQHGYGQPGERAFDRARFAELYDPQPLPQRRF